MNSEWACDVGFEAVVAPGADHEWSVIPARDNCRVTRIMTRGAQRLTVSLIMGCNTYAESLPCSLFERPRASLFTEEEIRETVDAIRHCFDPGQVTEAQLVNAARAAHPIAPSIDWKFCPARQNNTLRFSNRTEQEVAFSAMVRIAQAVL